MPKNVFPAITDRFYLILRILPLLAQICAPW